MSQHEGDEMDYAADDYEMAEVDEDMYFRGRVVGYSESDDDDEYDHLVCSFPILNGSLDYNFFFFSPKYFSFVRQFLLFLFVCFPSAKHKRENVECLCKISFFFSFSFCAGQ